MADYTDRRWPGTRSYLLAHKNGACVFLEESGDKQQALCRIHTFKPASCLDWKADLGKDECQSGLQTKFGLTVDAQGRICGEPAQIAAFESYIASLK